MSRGELAKLTGIPYSTLAEIENNEQKSSTKLHKIAAGLGARIEWLETAEEPIDTKAPSARKSSGLPIAMERHTRHEILVSREGAEIGAEWDKIEGDAYKQLAKDFIYGLVTAQKSAARRPGKVLSATDKKHGKYSVHEPKPD